MPWKLTITPTFKRGYRKVSSEMQERIENAIKNLCESEHPERLGVFKKRIEVRGIVLERVFAYELGRDCRIIYDVDRKEKTIIFYRVCSHKEVYGRN